MESCILSKSPWIVLEIYYTTRNEVVGGVYWFHYVYPSVDKSYVVR